MKMGLQQADLWTVLSLLNFLTKTIQRQGQKFPQFSQYDSSSILTYFHIICKIPSVEISTKVCL